MLYDLKYEFRLRRLQRKQQKVADAHDRKLREVRKSEKNPELIRAAEYEAWSEDQEFEGEIDQLQTRYLIHQIRKYRLTYPNQTDWEDESPPFYFRHLNREVSVRLRAAIRLEQKERFDRWARWVPLLAGLTGLFGTLIGLVVAVAKWL